MGVVTVVRGVPRVVLRHVEGRFKVVGPVNHVPCSRVHVGREFGITTAATTFGGDRIFRTNQIRTTRAADYTEEADTRCTDS